MLEGRVALVGEAWGADEDELKRGFVGAAGRELIRQLYDAGWFGSGRRAPWFTDPIAVADWWDTTAADAGITIHNVFNRRPERNDINAFTCPRSEDHLEPAFGGGRYFRAEFRTELLRLARELEAANPNVVVALGNTACWALLGQTAISKIRGTVAGSPDGAPTWRQLSSVSSPEGRQDGEMERSAGGRSGLLHGSIGAGRTLKVLPTYHPAGVLREWSNRHVTVLDLMKAARESAFSEVRRPSRKLYLDPTLADIQWFINDRLLSAPMIGFDIETSGDSITCIGFGCSKSEIMVIPFWDPRRGGNYWTTHEEERQAWNYVKQILSMPNPKVAQNASFDFTFLWRRYGIATRNMLHDTMLLSHSLQPESPKGLAYLGSWATNEPAWKLDRKGVTTLKKDD